MDQRVLQTLEFNKVIQEVAKHCATHLGQREIEELVPMQEIEKVQEKLDEMDEALAVLRVYASIPLGGIFDIKPQSRRAQIGGVLSAQELMEITSTIRASKQIRMFIDQINDENELSIPLLTEKKEQLPIVTHLEKEIQQSIDENGRVLDSASSTLRAVRQKKRAEEAKVRSRLESYTRGANASKMLSETIVTIRNDRYVLPVKAEYRSHYGGIVHDMSSSGQTLFIEPNSIVQLNNEIRTLAMKEKEEIEKILIALSAEVSAVATELFMLTDGLAAIDVIFAKAKYGVANRCTTPRVNDKGYIKLTKARHPLLPIEEAVANTIEFGDAVTTIVITGPNTGGKTVTLKTVGLCTLMAQAGIPIPVLDGSEIAVFHSIYADIGDEQSIEQSLSTFSSHMVNIVDILKKFDERSLLLFDELGSGTDPQEGAALAISILDEVHGTGARVMATTHYPELKAYGYNRQGVANASVEFDIDTLSPTYRLLIGVPGRSNAFEISDRLGLNRHIIDRAKKFTGTDSGEVNEMIASLETSRIHAEKDREQMAIQLAEAEQLRRDLEKELEEIQKNEQRLLEKATEKAEKIVRKASEESEAIMTELRNLRMHTSAQVKEHELIEMKKRLNQAQPKRVNQPKEKKVETRPLKIGDEVKSLDYGQTGTLIDQLDTGDWVVQIGILKMNLPESRLEYIRPKKEKMKSVTTVKRSSAPIKMELDLRGLRYEEAIQRTEKYIDDALLANLHQIHIIHGKGTGALREGVQTLLKRHSRVKNYRFGEAGEGGFGVTVAELK